ARKASAAAREPRGGPAHLGLPQPGRCPAYKNPDHQQHDDERKQWQRQGSRRALRTEWVEQYGDDLAIGDRESDDDDCKRHQNECRDDLAEAADRSPAVGQTWPGRLSRSRISLPVLKNGTHFLSTAT